MRRRGIVVIPVVGSILFLSAGLAAAQCAFDAPTKAKGIKTSMVRAYAGCPGITFPSPNTSTMTGVPGCAPPFALSPFEFGPDGSCSLKSSQSIESPCPIAPLSGCAMLQITARCTDIRDPGGATQTTAPGWAINLVLRITEEDPSSGDLTVIDVPLQVSFPQARNGRMRLNRLLPECLLHVFPCGVEWGACTSLQLLYAAVADPDGNIFAVVGSSSR